MRCRPESLILPFVWLFIISLCCTVQAATNDTDIEARWKFGKISGQMRTFYLLKDNKRSFDETGEAFAVGGRLSHETPWIADHFGGVVTGFLATPRFYDLSGTDAPDDKDQGYAIAEEAYFKTRYEKTIAKIWRQRIESPYINSNDSNLFSNTFEAYGVESTDIEGLKLHAAWVDKMKSSNSDRFISMTESAGVDGHAGGLVMLGANWKPTGKLSFRAWNYYTPDVDNTFFIEANYKHNISELLETHIKLQGVDQRNTGNDLLGAYTANEAGILLGLKYSAMTVDIGGTIVNDSGDVRNSWGSNPFFNNLTPCEFNRAGEKALYLAVGYDFTYVGVTGFFTNIKKGFDSTDDADKDASYERNEYNLNLSYKLDRYLGADFNRLSLFNSWAYQETNDPSESEDIAQVHIQLQYDF